MSKRGKKFETDDGEPDMEEGKKSKKHHKKKGKKGKRDMKALFGKKGMKKEPRK